MAMRGVASTLALAVVLAVVVDAQQTPHAARPPADITLRVYNIARIPPALIARAQKMTAGVYGEIGVRIQWAEATADPIAFDAEQLRVEPGDLAVVILNASMASRIPVEKNSLGIAMTSTEEGRIAYILFDRVRKAAAASDRNVMDVMGLVMAHEVGHLLLPAGSHSATGLMRAMWELTDLRVDQGQFRFTQTQAAVIRQSLSHPRIASASAAAAVSFAAPR